MRRSIDLYTRRYQYIVADGYLVAIYQHATDIDGDIVSDVDIVPETADELIAHRDIRTHTPNCSFSKAYRVLRSL